MLPWRPLGMLAFGLSAIFVFIRLHGDGYDLPEIVFSSQDELHLRPLVPTRSFLEVSRVVLDDYRDYYGDDSDNDDAFSTEEGDHHARHTYGQDQDQGHKFMAGWSQQWHLGKDSGNNNNSNKGSAKVVATDQAATNARDDKGRSGHDLLEEYQDGKQWIWLTNVWHDDGDCLLRQYRRPLDPVLPNNNATPWELMYTHSFPGPITHTSLSKRVLPPKSRNGHPTEKTESAQSRISIRLAVVYKVVQDEHIAYHSRIYHFGVFHSHLELGGSTPIKDFSLDHDTILYSRLSDISHFRSLKLPRLKVGSTSFERPFALSSGVPGPSTSCDDRKNIPYRMSYLTSVPSGSDSNLKVMMGQVREARDIWTYNMTVAHETTDADIMTGNKLWLSKNDWMPVYLSLTHETNMIDDEQQQSGVPVQKPFFVKSTDGSSINVPVKNIIKSYEAMRISPPMTTLRGEEDVEGGKDGSSPHDQSPESWDHLLVQDGLRGSERLPLSSWEHVWSESTISLGSVESVETDSGVVNDATNIMVLKTTRNEILVLRRAVQTTEDGQRRVSPWELSMASVVDTGGIITGVLAMKIINVPALPLKDSEGEVTHPVAKEDHPLGHGDRGDDELYASPTAPSEPSAPTTRNILLIVYGSGSIRGFDLDHPQESSSFEDFLKDKFAVVIESTRKIQIPEETVVANDEQTEAN
ncbi:hypothetical protein EC968_004525 [Mortierella alpina]|nr:hypothetical protein EC968_004525 [Mortierella alpina]